MEREKLIELIFRFNPLIRKKLFKDIRYKNSVHQMHLMWMIDHHNGNPMKFFGEKLMISKPNLTKVVNRLIEEGLIERKTDEKDRRIINLYITEKGKSFIEQHKEAVKASLRKKLDVLSDEDIGKLIKNFEEVESILGKLD